MFCLGSVRSKLYGLQLKNPKPKRDSLLCFSAGPLGVNSTKLTLGLKRCLLVYRPERRTLWTRRETSKNGHKYQPAQWQDRSNPAQGPMASPSTAPGGSLSPTSPPPLHRRRRKVKETIKKILPPTPTYLMPQIDS
jgi:hypothetical protein